MTLHTYLTITSSILISLSLSLGDKIHHIHHHCHYLNNQKLSQFMFNSDQIKIRKCTKKYLCFILLPVDNVRHIKFTCHIIYERFFIRFVNMTSMTSFTFNHTNKPLDSENIPLILLIIHTLSPGKFHNELKISKVKPLFKTEDTSQINNYKPISFLTSVSKNYEYSIFHQLINYMDTHQLLSLQPFGFLRGYSTELAALRLMGNLTK